MRMAVYLRMRRRRRLLMHLVRVNMRRFWHRVQSTRRMRRSVERLRHRARGWCMRQMMLLVVKRSGRRHRCMHRLLVRLVSCRRMSRESGSRRLMRGRHTTIRMHLLLLSMVRMLLLQVRLRM